MCTVTIVPIRPMAGGRVGRWRMACSRDERHGRAAARPPTSCEIKGRRVLMPIDPSSGGTWVAVNDAGLALTLLNYNLPEPPTGRSRSRGEVIPTLMGCGTAREVLELLPSIAAHEMMPFRLVFCDGHGVFCWRSTEPAVLSEGVVGVPFWSPEMFTSSGLGDHLVEPPRRELFNTWFGDDPAAYTDEQLAFHQHRWDDRPHLSVAMSREDARTVSYTAVDIASDRVTMRYHPDRPDLPAEDVVVSLPRQPDASVSP